VSKLAALFGADAASPRQAATVPISIHHGATFEQFGVDLAYAPNTFGTIFGPVATASPAQGAGSGSLVNRTVDWSQSFSNGTAPTSLDGVEVRINGQNAFIAFTGLGEDFGRQFDQINFIAPDLDPIPMGSGVTVEIFKDEQLVGATTVNMDLVSPALFAFSPVDGDGNTYYAAALADFSAFVAPSDLFGVPDINGVPIRPVAPAEVISIFGTGFGATNPPSPAGRQLGPAELAPLAQTPAIRVGGMPVPPGDVFYAGLAPGLTGVYQFNIRVPNLMDGNHRIEIDVQGVTTPLNAFLPVRAAAP
jgi:uncharacterized protein (TIGR03437 family)